MEPRPVDNLTAREREVMMLVVTGLMNTQIAAQLGVTEATVKLHRGRVREKLGVRSMAALVKMAERADLKPASFTTGLNSPRLRSSGASRTASGQTLRLYPL
jgi:DNA-binding CsgD family transcriptional regulator